MAYIQIGASDYVIGGTEVSVPASYVQLIDDATGYNLSGSYHIQIQTGSVLGPVYKAKVGLPAADSATAMTVCRAVLFPNGNIYLRNCVERMTVGVVGVNSTVAFTPFSDGSYLETGVVTERTLGGSVFGVGGLLDHYGSTQGDILYRGATGWTVLAPGTAGYVLQTGGTGANPSWVAGSGGGVTSISQGTGIACSPNPIVATGTVSLAAIADADLLANTSGSSAAPVPTTLSALIDYALGNTRGAVLYRGASGWATLAPGASTYVLTSNGSGADPSWQAGGGGGSGVTSLQTLTGALTLTSPDGSVAIGTSGSDITLEAINTGSGSTYHSYDAMVQADNPRLYFTLGDLTNTAAADTQISESWAKTGSPTAQTTSLLYDGSKSTTFGSTGNYYSGTVFAANNAGVWAFESWLKFPSLPSGSTRAGLFNMDASGTGYIGIEVDSSGFVHVIFQGVADVTSAAQLSAATIYHMVVSYDAGAYNGTNTWRVYLNGSLAASGTKTPNNIGNTTATIGARYTNGGQGVLMQKLALYYSGNAIPLAQPRILAHYIGGHSGLYN